MKLSIITVNRDNRDGLLRTAESIAKQTFTDFEWLVVDGGSTDGSQDVLDKYASIVSWSVSEPDGGIYEAMNKGLRKAGGEYVQFLNSGDAFADDGVLEKVFSGGCLADVNYADQWCMDCGKVVEKRNYPDVLTLDYLFRNPLGHQASFVKTALAKQHPYRVKYTISADRAFFMELYLSGASFAHLAFPAVLFDTDGIGSRKSTLKLRRDQLAQIKRELLPSRAVDDMESLMAKADEYDFVMRTPVLRQVYKLFKRLQEEKRRVR